MNKENIKILLILDLFLISILFSLIYITYTTPKVNETEYLPQFDEKTIILTGDSGMGNDLQFKVAEAMKDYCNGGCDLGVIAGDVIYPNGVLTSDDEQFESKFEEPYKDIGFPFYIAFGNHDYRGCTECYLEYSSLSDRFKMPSGYYDLRLADDLHLFIIDTEEFDELQREWLQVSLKESNSKYKVVVGHRPLLTYEENYIDEPWGGDNGAYDVICDNADLYIAGHSHLLEYNKVCGIRQIVSGGGGALTRTIEDKEGPIFYYEGNGFVALKLKEYTLEIDYVDIEGNILASFRR